MNGFDCRLIFSGIVSIVSLTFAAPAHAACTMPNSAPDAEAGDIAFNIDEEVMQYCNGADQWVNMGAPASAGADEVGAVTINKWCRGDGAQVVCDQDAPAETDPQVGTLTNTKWCRTDGTQVICDQDAPPGAANCRARGR